LSRCERPSGAGAAALAALVLVGALFALSGLASAGGEASRTLTVTAREFAFQPETLEVSEGEVVRLRFRNAGDLAHSFQIEELGVRTPTLQSGGERVLRLRPEEPGTYRFRCTVPGHEQAGMTGTLMVVEPGS